MESMAPPPVSTHLVTADMSRGLVRKSFRLRDRREPEREWTALRLLAEFAPGLSADPIGADLDADPPVIEMSWLPGTPLGGTPLTDGQATALAQALNRLWHAAPAATVVDAFRASPNSSAFLTQVRALLAAERPVFIAESPGPAEPVEPATLLVDQALRAGARWLAQSRLDRLTGTGLVLGHGDPNLSNYLSDGTGIQIVDFEDSGPSHRAFELAILVEHRSAWAESQLDAEHFTGRFDLTEPDVVALRQYRRLAAMYWLIKLLPGRSANHRYSAEVVESQARRLLTLVG
ncbi:MAG TPA: aminoglycoside phosphotransferase family protein [Streptosporangiaceae bacterium]|nr:aminoglycoside phosphotransferase family protein [Streptosporangiaceae bacterium]